MKNRFPLLSFLLVLLLIFLSFRLLMPHNVDDSDVSEESFSTERAFSMLEKIAVKPHYHGSDEHDRVRDVLVDELKALGFEVETQEGFVYRPNARGLDKPVNIVARWEGSENSRALLLLSHYDSALVPSPGASDAGSGIVTILESLRAYKASGKTPENDIIVLFSDAEEIGLDGARLFVNEHRWAKNVGIVLNFEARGSGGPSNMILETNGGNKNLIKAFSKADVPYPVASSLMYSVYKMLPNDTDSTVFREDGDIDSFFFAFIDDHFDYHTANDTVENLDVETLAHQGSYLMALLDYFSNSSLKKLKADQDYVYTNMPFIGMVYYPFLYILPMLLVGVVLFFIIFYYGYQKEKIRGRDVGKGFLILLVGLILSGVVAFFGWELITNLYPQYVEVQHGFKYNGHSYVAFFVLLTNAIMFLLYRKWGRKHQLAGLFVAPLVLWLLVNTAVFLFLKGAAYFIIPVYFALLIFWIIIKQDRPNLLLLALLSAPAIFIFSPLIQFFPVGLGSDHVFISAVFTVLLFGLLLPVLGAYQWKKFLAAGCLIAAIGFLIGAHANSDFDDTRQKPNSLLYYLDETEGKAYWLTYDELLDDWTKGYLGEAPEEASKYVTAASGSKYNTQYTYAAEAPIKMVEGVSLKVQRDTIVNRRRNVQLTFYPERKINQLNLYADASVQFNTLQFNGKTVPIDSSGYAIGSRQSNMLLRYWMDDRDSLEVRYSTASETGVTFTTLSYSFDLLDHSQFSINKRPKDMMPKPFIITDAIVVKEEFNPDSFQLIQNDSVYASEERKIDE
ncbi:M20/M25/M40 family metallo-hydrolase [Luteirhabdus pelagi]|uniref:M20/M25/M40 family metallo-hydrolase n=1 Tax=Luteirhabdus pelagi TaxID=2792783 RepID=UPI0019395C42|nr:M20/M25/M40 family metallo-hydrolase [Luteirhabdus pelagi]